MTSRAQPIRDSDIYAPAHETHRLSVLLEVNEVLSSMPHLNMSLQGVLEILADYLDAVRGVVSILRPDGDLRVETSNGPGDRLRAATDRIGEGISERVVQSGRPSVTPRAGREPSFLHPARRRPKLSRQELSFISVPITSNGRAVGALALELRFTPERDLESLATFLEVVTTMIARALMVHRLIEPNPPRLVDVKAQSQRTAGEGSGLPNLVGASAALGQVYAQVRQVAGTNTTALIRGESGTGKELVARAIHANSRRAGKPFVTVSCAALPESLIETELFGHEKGAFTGAAARKKGRFELAEGGTLFLDEIGDLSLAVQVKLLRVLQEREFERVGGTGTIRADVRLVAATNKDLERAIAAGTFREDLYYRLNVFTIAVPPLRERTADVLPLVDHFLEKFGADHGRSIKRISTAAVEMLAGYHWPGNVRELAHALERAVLTCDGEVVDRHHFPPALQVATSRTMARVSLKDAVTVYERDLLWDALRTTRGNRAKAARLLDTTERIVNYRLRRYGIDATRFAQPFR